MTDKRLLCIVSSLDTGGAETFMMKIFRSLPEKYKLDFIVSTESGYYEDEVLSLGGRIHRIPWRTKHPFLCYSAIKKIVLDNEYKYVLKLCDTPIGYFDLLAAKKGGASKICVRSCNACSSEGRLRHIVNTFLRPFFNAIVDVKIAPSKLAAEYTFGKKEVDKGNVNILHNAVDLNVYRFSAEGRNRIRKEFNIRPNQILIGHIGRFNNQKNHKFLIEVFQEIQSLHSEAVLMLVGDGELKENIINQINSYNLEEKVIIAGIRSDVPDLLSAMDVFVFPSLYEGMPNTIIEAQATGLPCVISDTITKEAAITPLVKYLPFDYGYSGWAEESINSKLQMRMDTTNMMRKAGYDIKSVIEEFITLIYGDEH